MTGLQTLSKARELLATCSIDEAIDIRNQAEAVRKYCQAAKEGLEAQNHAAEIKLRAERRAGELLSEITGGRGGDRKSSNTLLQPLSELGVTRMQSSRWQQEAAVPDDTFEPWIASATAEQRELTQAGLLALARNGTVAAAANTGEIEWYTPPEYIELARDVMGSIDIDPASSDTANETVEASLYYTAIDDGLSRDWHGNIWLNPPYAAGMVSAFTGHLLSQIDEGHTKQAVLLVNNATDTQWFADVAAAASAMCFKTGRIAFISPANGERQTGAAQGQVFVYFGKRHKRFANLFGSLGWIAYL